MELQKKRYNDFNRDDIVRYLEAGGAGNDEGLLLTEKQTELFKRWEFAAEKIRERKYKREQIAAFIQGAFQVSRDTAMRDIVNAEYVFAASAPLNKQFLIQNRIELLQIKINECYISKDYLNAGLLEKTLQKYIDIYPETKPVRSKHIINYVIQQNTMNVTNITIEQASWEADDMAKQLEGYNDK